ncbi:MAG: hypothetical protein HYX69_00215 [Planctomycetia bacterium]|nr:hypothetical protein [Planctomycetia bacterium]
MGDSYSDEYSPIAAGLYNWVELLVAGGRADFGPFATFPSGDPRNTGGAGSYTYNYAKGGATTSSALGSTTFLPTVNNNNSQPGSPNRPDIWPGIRGAGTSAAIQYASQEIGGNDMLDQIINRQKLLLGLDSGTMNPILSRFEQITNIATANYTSPLKMVLVEYPDLGSMPVFGGLQQINKDSIRLNMTYFNNSVAALAAVHGLATVDLFSLWDNLRNSNGTTIHGIYISPGTSGGGLADLRSAWLSDGLHPTPIFQAMWANAFIGALNATYGESIAALSPKEMVTLTGLDPQQAPIANAGGAYAIAAHNALALNASASTDPNVGDVPFLQYSWDINGDGIFGDATGAQPDLSWAQLHTLGIGVTTTYRVAVRVDDTFGGITTSLPVDLKVAALPGDLNLDADVDVSDIQVVAGHWLTNDAVADANGDGSVDISDVQTIAAHWTAGGGGGAAVSVPEPPTVTLVLAAGLAWAMSCAARWRSGGKS